MDSPKIGKKLGVITRQWSSEVASADHIDLQATAMGLNCSGKLALLGGKRYLALIKIEDSPHSLGSFLSSLFCIKTV